MDLAVRLRLGRGDHEERERAKKETNLVHREKSGKINRKAAAVNGNRRVR